MKVSYSEFLEDISTFSVGSATTRDLSEDDKKKLAKVKKLPLGFRAPEDEPR